MLAPSLSSQQFRKPYRLALPAEWYEQPPVSGYGKGGPGLGNGGIVEAEHVAHALEDEIGGNAGCARLQVHASGAGKEEVARATEERRRRKARHVAVDGREQGIAEGASRGVEQGP